MRQSVQALLSLLAVSSTVAAIGCGGSMSGSINPTTATTPQTSTQVKIGDAPANRVISFEVTIGSMSLTPTSGSAVTVLAGSQRVELTHISATSEPLSALKVPQGSYNSASFTVSSPEITFINNVGVVQKFESSVSKTITISFSPALTIGASSSIVDIDLNIANSLTFDAL
jgi:ABC-type Fe3+-hydroxamate transport system substrate-binding protein